jgi:hypothetical protein
VTNGAVAARAVMGPLLADQADLRAAAGIRPPPAGRCAVVPTPLFRAAGTVGAVATATVATAAMTASRPITQAVAIRSSLRSRCMRLRRAAFPPSAAAC